MRTAAFVLGPTGDIQLFDRLGVDGLILSPALDRFATRGMGTIVTQRVRYGVAHFAVTVFARRRR